MQMFKMKSSQRHSVWKHAETYSGASWKFLESWRKYILTTTTEQKERQSIKGTSADEKNT